MERKRLLGIKIIGGFAVFGGIIAIGGQVMSSMELNSFDMEHIKGLVVSIILIVSGAGVLFLKEWARKLLLILNIGLLSVFIWLLAKGVLADGAIYLIRILTPSFLIYITIIAYLTRPKVKRQFK